MTERDRLNRISDANRRIDNLTAEVERLTRERDGIESVLRVSQELVAANRDRRQDLEADRDAALARVASLEAALRDALSEMEVAAKWLDLLDATAHAHDMRKRAAALAPRSERREGEPPCPPHDYEDDGICIKCGGAVEANYRERKEGER